VSVLIFSLFAERGGRELHGNFGWPAIASNNVLFLVTTIGVARHVITRGFGRLVYIALAVLGLHVVAGAVYVVHYLSSGTYT
jgi:hypothetical protein